MPTEFEPVLSVDEYYDGPRSGIAMYGGRAYRYKSRFVDVHGADDVDDIFDLSPLDGQGPALVVHAVFEVAADALATQPGELRKLVVQWTSTDRTGV